MLKNQKFFQIICKYLIIYWSYYKKVGTVILKSVIILLHHSANNFYWLYCSSTMLATCDPRFHIFHTLVFSYITTIIFIFSAIITLLYNNEYFINKMNNGMGLDFTKVYLHRYENGVYLKPFMKIWIAFTFPYVFDLFTNFLDFKILIAQIDFLNIEKSSLVDQGKMEESRDLAKIILVLSNQLPLGFFTKCNLVIASYIYR